MYLCVYVCMYYVCVCVCMCVCMYLCMYVCVCIYVYIYIYIYICVCVCVLLLLLLLLYIYIYVCLCIIIIIIIVIITTMDVYVCIDTRMYIFCPHVRTPASLKMFLCRFVIGSLSAISGHIPILVKIWATRRKIYVKPYTPFCTYPLQNSLNVYRCDKYF